MIVESNGVLDAPVVDVPIVGGVVHMGVGVVDTRMVCVRSFLCDMDFSHDSNAPIGRIVTSGLNSSS